MPRGGRRKLTAKMKHARALHQRLKNKEAPLNVGIPDRIEAEELNRAIDLNMPGSADAESDLGVLHKEFDEAKAELLRTEKAYREAQNDFQKATNNLRRVAFTITDEAYGLR